MYGWLCVDVFPNASLAPNGKDTLVCLFFSLYIFDVLLHLCVRGFADIEKLKRNLKRLNKSLCGEWEGLSYGLCDVAEYPLKEIKQTKTYFLKPSVSQSDRESNTCTTNPLLSLPCVWAEQSTAAQQWTTKRSPRISRRFRRLRRPSRAVRSGE